MSSVNNRPTDLGHPHFPTTSQLRKETLAPSAPRAQPTPPARRYPGGYTYTVSTAVPPRLTVRVPKPFAWTPRSALSKVDTEKLAFALDKWVAEQGPDDYASGQLAHDIKMNVAEGLSHLRLVYDGTPPPLEELGIKLQCEPSAGRIDRWAEGEGRRGGLTLHERFNDWIVEQPDPDAAKEFVDELANIALRLDGQTHRGGIGWPAEAALRKGVIVQLEYNGTAPTFVDAYGITLLARPKVNTEPASVDDGARQLAARLNVHIASAKDILRDRALQADPAVAAALPAKTDQFQVQLRQFFAEVRTYDTKTISILDLSALKDVLPAQASKPEYARGESEKQLAIDAEHLQSGINSIRKDLSARISKLGEDGGAVELWKQLDGSEESAAAFMRLVADMPARQKVATFIDIRNAALDSGRVEDPVVKLFVPLFGAVEDISMFKECNSRFDELGLEAQELFKNALTPTSLQAMLKKVMSSNDLAQLALPSDARGVVRDRPEAELAGSMLREARQVYGFFEKHSNRGGLPSFEDAVVQRLKDVAGQFDGLREKFEGTGTKIVWVDRKMIPLSVAKPNGISELVRSSADGSLRNQENARELREFHKLFKRADAEINPPSRSRQMTPEALLAYHQNYAELSDQAKEVFAGSITRDSQVAVMAKVLSHIDELISSPDLGQAKEIIQRARRAHNDMASRASSPGTLAPFAQTLVSALKSLGPDQAKAWFRMLDGKADDGSKGKKPNDVSRALGFSLTRSRDADINDLKLVRQELKKIQK